MRLAHLHLPGLAPYAVASEVQQRIVAAFLAFKADSTKTCPPPTVITAEFKPVYTCGRREAGSLNAAQEAHLRRNGTADFYYTSRGGQTTFHGPGQLVAYPILDLKQHALSPRCHINLLEEVVIQTCGKYGIKGFRTGNPGVWTSQDRKICAVGVHLRRNISSHGIGLNVSTDLDWFRRIVACGLEDKTATSLAELGVKDVSVADVAKTYVELLATSLKGVQGVEQITKDDLPP